MNKPKQNPSQAEALYRSISAASAGYRRCALHAGDAEQITAIIGESLERHQPIPVMIYWAKGLRDEPGQAERKGIDFLKEMLGKLNPPGVELSVVFTDTHVALNGIALPEAYLDGTDRLFKARFQDEAKGLYYAGMQRLSALVPPAQNYTASEAGMARLRAMAEQSSMPPEQLALLTPRAEKYYQQTDGQDPEMVAKMYYELCKSERDAVGAAFKGHVFLTYNHAKQHDFSVPTGMAAFNMYAFKHHLSDKPWNTPETVVGAAYGLEHQGVVCPLPRDKQCHYEAVRS